MHSACTSATAASRASQPASPAPTQSYEDESGDEADYTRAAVPARVSPRGAWIALLSRLAELTRENLERAHLDLSEVALSYRTAWRMQLRLARARRLLASAADAEWWRLRARGADWHAALVAASRGLDDLLSSASLAESMSRVLEQRYFREAPQRPVDADCPSGLDPQEGWLRARLGALTQDLIGGGRDTSLLSPLQESEEVHWGGGRLMWYGFTAPRGVDAHSSISWLYSLLIADALELGDRFPYQLAPRPSSTAAPLVDSAVPGGGLPDSTTLSWAEMVIARAVHSRPGHHCL